MNLKHAHTQIAVFSFAWLLATAAAPGATLFWGGDGTNINNGVPPFGGNGVWDTATQNWATDQAGTSYQAWNNAANDIASLSTNGYNSGSSFNITNTASVTVGGLAFTNGGAGDVFLRDDGSTRTITLAGASPVVSVQGNTAADLTFAGANLVLAGTNGFTKTGSGRFVLSGDEAHTLSGTVNVLGGQLQLNSGRLANVGTFNVSGNGVELQLGNNNFDRIGDTAAINLSAGAVLNFIGQGAAANTETVGAVNFTNASVRIYANTAAGKLAINEFNRGDRGTVAFGNMNDPDANVTVVSNAPPSGTLPWAVGNVGGHAHRFMQYTTNFKVVASSAAPQDLSTWDAQGWTTNTDVHYDWGSNSLLTAALDSDITVNTLSVGPTNTQQNATTLNLGGRTLALRGLSAASTGGSPGSSLFLSNGVITAQDGTETLYIHNPGTTPTVFTNVAIGRAGASDLTYDVVFAMPGANFTWNSSSNNAY